MFTPYIPGGLPNSVSFANQVAAFTITAPTTNTYQVQMTHAVAITAGKTYTACYSAIADAERTIEVDINMGGTLVNGIASYMSLTGRNSAEYVSTTWANKSFTFIANLTNPTARIDFNVGMAANPISVKLDNIGVYEGSNCPSVIPPPSSSSSSSPSNGSSSSFSSASSAPIAPGSWVHPGAHYNQADLDYVKVKIAAGAEPWTGKFNRGLRGVATASNNNTAPAGEAGKDDARKALANALAWHYTGDDTYANNAVRILNVWSRTFNGFGDPSGQNLLVAGWIGSLMGPAAELMLGYNRWAAADIAATRMMFRNRFYPALNVMSTWNGNVDLTQIDAMFAIAVFNEDRAEFDLAVTRFNNRIRAYMYLTTDGAVPFTLLGAGWNQIKLMDGLMQESCRTGGYNGAGYDGGHHAQYALAAAVSAAEVAWNQGVDLYGMHSQRMMSALELLSRQLIAGNMLGACSTNAAADRTSGEFYDTFEIGYNHYHNRRMMPMTNTQTLLSQTTRVNAANDWNIFFETTTHQK